MAIEVIGTIKPKNGGKFPVVEASDVALPDGKRMDAAIAEAGKLLDENSGTRVRMWFGTQEEYDALESHDPDVYYNIFEDVVPS